MLTARNLDGQNENQKSRLRKSSKKPEFGIEKEVARSGNAARYLKKCMAPPPESTIERINLASCETRKR